MRECADGKSAIGQMEQPKICKLVGLSESLVRRMEFHVHEYLSCGRTSACVVASLIMFRAVRVTMLMIVILSMTAAVLVTMRGVGSVCINQRTARLGRMIELFLQPVH